LSKDTSVVKIRFVISLDDVSVAIIVLNVFGSPFARERTAAVSADGRDLPDRVQRGGGSRPYILQPRRIGVRTPGAETAGNQRDDEQRLARHLT
jgi:hypothetical protein